MTPSRAETLFRATCVVLALEQVGLVAFGLWVRGYVPPEGAEVSTKALSVYGTVLAILGIVFAAGNLMLATAARRPWLWVAGLSNLAAAVLCCPPAGLLLFVWLRADTKRHFGVDTPEGPPDPNGSSGPAA